MAFRFIHAMIERLKLWAVEAHTPASGGPRSPLRIGPKRVPSTNEGLTRTQAEAQMRHMIGSLDHIAVRRERITVEECGELFVARVRAMGRKRATIEVYSSTIRVHLGPFFGEKSLEQVGRRVIEASSRTWPVAAAHQRRH
jgi:hypothetical protein